MIGEDAVGALIHQDGHLGDPYGGEFRAHWYSRIVKHFNFVNMIQAKNFTEVAKVVQFSVNIYRGRPSETNFEQFTLGYIPSQVEESYAHDGSGTVGGLRGSDGKWNTSGHLKRIFSVDSTTLRAMSDLNGDIASPPNQTRFVQPFSEDTLAVLRKISASKTLGSALAQAPWSGGGARPVRQWYSTADLSETEQVKDRTLEKSTKFRNIDNTIYQGPHFFVGNPLNKTPRRVCSTHASYDVIDLNIITDDFIPRSNFGIIDKKSSELKLSKCRWDTTRLHSDFYRVAIREMINLTSERSFIPSIIPPKINHINTIRSVAFTNERDLLNFHSLSCSIVLDGLYKMSGRDHFKDSDAQKMPWIELDDTAIFRSLQLNCLTSHYQDLWERNAIGLRPLPWSQHHPFQNGIDSRSDAPWSRKSAVRSEYGRRLALIEIDVLVAQSLGLSLDQLIELYEIYFPVLQKKESNTYFDAKGDVVWISAKGTNNVGYFEPGGKKITPTNWKNIVASSPSELVCTVMDDTIPGGAREVTRHFVGPFTQCDRIEDYRRAWAHFERLKSEEAA
jgi:hypothetical protein